MSSDPGAGIKFRSYEREFLKQNYKKNWTRDTATTVDFSTTVLPRLLYKNLHIAEHKIGLMHKQGLQQH